VGNLLSKSEIITLIRELDNTRDYNQVLPLEIDLIKKK